MDVQQATQWLVSSLSLLAGALGPESAHYQRLKEHTTSYPKWPDVDQAFGVLLAAKDDLEHGALLSVRTLIQAELFDDFLGQAEELLATGYFQPAAVVAGSVLEDGLRRLCTREQVQLTNKPKLDSMNSALAKKGVYSALTQKRLTALADIRNNAAHGNWSAFSASDVDKMIRDVRDFMGEHFG